MMVLDDNKADYADDNVNGDDVEISYADNDTDDSDMTMISILIKMLMILITKMIMMQCC